MMIRIGRLGLFGSVVAVGLLLASEAAAERQASTKTELEGTWDGESSVGGGKTRTFAAGEVWVTFKGNIVVGKNFLAPEGTERHFEVDPKAMPKHFTFIQPDGKQLLGIYMIEGDTATIAISLGSARPTGFAESDQTFRVSILKLKRRK